MNILFPVNVKGLLISLVSDAVLHLWAKHHNRAVHEIGHHIFRNDLISLKVNHVKVDFGVRDHLHSFVVFDVGYVTTILDRVVVTPFFFSGELVQKEAEEQNLCR